MGNNGKFSCYIIGDGSLLAACGELLLDSGHDIYGVLSSNPFIREWAEEKGIPYAEPSCDNSEFLKQQPFDYLFSIVYLSLIPGEILRLPHKMAINFHDALLPEYAGIHATSWAIMNREERHGVTWHEMVSGVDKGNILKQKSVVIEEDETAFSLNVKCYEAGLESFKELIAELAGDSYSLIFQDLNRRTYYGKYQRPPAGSVLSWQSSAEEMDAMVRALQFGNYQNQLGIAKLAVHDEYVIVDQVHATEEKSGFKPGTVVQATGLKVTVATVSNDMEIRSVMSIHGAPLSIEDWAKKYDFTAGTLLPEVDGQTRAKITLLQNEVSRWEEYWINKCSQINTLTSWPGIIQTIENPQGSPSTIDFTIPEPFIHYAEQDYGNRLAACLAAIGSFLAKESMQDTIQILFGYQELRESLLGLDKLFAVHVPVMLDLSDTLAFRKSCDMAREEIASVKQHKTFLHDLYARNPQMKERIAGKNRLPVIVESVNDLKDDSQPVFPGCGIRLVVPERGNTWRIVFDEALLTKEEAGHSVRRLASFMARAAALPDAPISMLPALAEDEYQKVVYERNHTVAEYPRDKCMHELFKERVKQSPESIAVLCQGKSLTYRELEERASRLAAFLNRTGIGRGGMVGIFIERSLDMLVGLLGVLKSGGTYVPIDPFYPGERILHMIEDANIKMILTQEAIKSKLPASKAGVVCLDTDWQEIESGSAKSSSRKYYSYSGKDIRPDDSAYVIFTSGSTGKPKGVEITHRGLTNFLCAMAKCPGFTKEDRVLALTTICFDIAGLELYLPLISGGQVEILPTEIARNGFELKERVESGWATVVQATPATWEMLIEAGWNKKTDSKLLCGGEALSKELAQKLLDRSREVWNMYGPTETTIWSSVSQIHRNKEITVGRPIANTQFYIVDKELNPVPDGVEGELCIGGDGVAKGYWNRPELTGEKFIVNPFGGDLNLKIYKTGDAARYLPDGRVVCLGRMDNQIKLRGFRIELGEIETALQKQPHVKQAVVVMKEDLDGYKSLAAFLVPDSSQGLLPGNQLSKAVREVLPDYMVPASYFYLERLPLTLNLKVDRKMLAATPVAQLLETYGYKEEDRTMPAHENDRIKADEWKKEKPEAGGPLAGDLKKMVAGVAKIPVEDLDTALPMGEYGFDSIRFTVLSKRIKDTYSITVTPAQFYTYETVTKLKEYLLKTYGEELSRYYASSSQSKTDDAAEGTVSGNFAGDLAKMIAGIVKIPAEELERKTPLGEYGFDSIRFTVLSKRIKDTYNIFITPAQFYTYTTVSKIVDFLWHTAGEEICSYYGNVPGEIRINSGIEEPKKQETNPVPEFKNIYEKTSSGQKERGREPVAIIGMGGMFPQSPDLETFWEHIVNKRDLITPVPADRWDSNDYYVRMAEENNTPLIKWGGFLEDIDKFDAAFFNISPREAEQMDPQQRIFLETVWKAVEDAGYKASELSGTNTGVYVGAVSSEYWDRMLCSGLEADSYTISGNINCVIANRVSYLLNLKGASATIDTACSSSLVAIHRAVAAIQYGDCDMAIAGGVNVIVHPFMHTALGKNGMLSADGRCKTFDSQANGYVRGEGAGVLILKPLSKAIEDGDNIHAVIKGSSENHGGRTNSLTAPNPNAQADLLIRAYREAEINPATVTYMEMHGTGTSLGDPIECNGMKMAFEELSNKAGKPLSQKYCGIGSVKTNIGHLEAGAGVAGVLKIVLAMKKGILPGMIHFKELNPYIDLERSPFYIAGETEDWKRLTSEAEKIIPRRAGVSSFGFGGSNAHVILEEYNRKKYDRSIHRHSANLFLLSAKNEDRLRNYAMNMLQYLKDSSKENAGFEAEFSNILYTLQTGREPMNSRLAIVVSNTEELVQKLERYCAGENGIPQVYIGSAGTETKNLITLLEGEEGRKFMETLIRQREYGKLAQFWVCGMFLNWDLLYEKPKPGRMSLPTYPFARERHWISRNEKKYPPTLAAAQIHPLLQQNISDFFEQRFCSLFSGQEFFIKDYIVEGRPTLPAIACLEMVRAGVMLSAGKKEQEAQGLTIRNVKWAQPVVLKDKEISLNIRLFPEEAGDIYYEIYSQSEAGASAFKVYSQGQAILEKAAEVLPIHIQTLQVQCSRSTLTAGQCYELYRKMGLDYGPGYQVIREMHIGENQALAEVVLPSCSAGTHDRFVMHPGIMDSILQAVLGFIASRGQEPSKPVVPVALQEFRLWGKCASHMWVRVQYNDEKTTGERTPKADVDVYDDQGVICIQIRGFSVGTMERNSGSNAAEGMETLTFHPGWKAEEVHSGNTHQVYEQRMVILCEPETAFQDKEGLASPQVDCIMLQSGQKEIEKRFQSYAFEVFNKIQKLCQDKPRGSVLVQIVVSRHQEQQLFAALGGLLKTAHLENSRIFGQLIEVESWENIVQKLQENSQCPMDQNVQYRDGRRWVAVWNEVKDPMEKTRIPWKDHGVYLITGGAGGLGLIFSQEIVRKVKNPVIILTGRSSLTREKQDKIKTIRESGARIEYRQVNVAEQEEVIQLIRDVQKQFGTINGIIHGAGVIRDNFIFKKTQEELQEVLAPKVSGLVYLDQASKELQLDFFVFFSSISGSLGNIGQADYAMANEFMSVYAGYRNALVVSKQRYGQTLAMIWPLWEEGGMAVSEEIKKMVMQNMGMTAMAASSGIKAFYQGLMAGKDQVMVLEGRVAVLKEKLLPKVNMAGFQPKAAPAVNLAEAAYSGKLLEKMQFALMELVSTLLKVKADDIDIHTELSEYGFDSITYIEFANTLNLEYKLELTPAIFFEYPTVQSFAEYLVSEYSAELAFQLAVTTKSGEQEVSMNESKENIKPEREYFRLARAVPPSFSKPDTGMKDSIAIVGMSGIFPLAKDVDELWDNLLAGKDCITEIPESRWDWRKYYGDPDKEANKTNIKWGGFIDGMDEFDPLFFGISPREAELMDPQQRLLMMYVWKVIEDAGYSPQSLSPQTGIFVGTAGCSGYSGLIAQSNIEIGEYFSTGTLPSVGPNRMSYFLNFHGPSEPVETACSSSLVAIHRAVTAIENGACEMAIAGGVNTIVTPENHMSLNKAGMLSLDGRCKAFSDQADGFVRSEGVGMLFLKKLKDAELAGDHIYGVIRGTAENHGGRANSLTAPNPKAQAELLRTAYTKAGIDPRTVTYIEAHGTGTELGDPIEINGLKAAFKELYETTGDIEVAGSHCGLGSVKTNIGHLELAAGVAGVIKVLLQLKHKVLVKNLHCDRVNPYIQLSGSPFYIVQEQKEWKALQDSTGKDIPRRSGVSSFGFGGVNAHVVIEEYIPQEQTSTGIWNPVLIVLSAKNEERLKEQVRQLWDAITAQQFEDNQLGSMAFTLQVGREAMEERLAIIVESIAELKAKLSDFLKGRSNIEGLYWGQVKRNKETIAIFTADDDLEKLVDVWIAKRKYKKLLSLWVKGFIFDWNKLYGGIKPRRISMPTYSFAKERYWIATDELKGSSNTASSNTTSFLHPLLHQNNSDFSEQRFTSRFTGQEFFIDQNRTGIHGVFPEMAQLEMARAAFVKAMGSLQAEQAGVRLKNVVWCSTLAIREKAIQVNIGLYPGDHGEAVYEIYSEAEDPNSESAIYSQGSAELFYAAETPPLDIKALQAECCQTVLDSRQLGEETDSAEVGRISPYQGINKAYIGLEQVVVELTLPDGLVSTQNQFVLHPSLLQSVLHSAIFLRNESGNGKRYRPLSLQEIEIIGNPVSPIWAFICYSHDGKGKVPKLDIQLSDHLGNICVRMRGMEMQEIQKGSY